MVNRHEAPTLSALDLHGKQALGVPRWVAEGCLVTTIHYHLTRLIDARALIDAVPWSSESAAAPHR